MEIKLLFPSILLITTLTLTVCAQDAINDINNTQSTICEVTQWRINVLIKLLGSMDQHIRDLATQGLVEIGQPAVSSLINNLEGKAWRGSPYVAETLRRIAIKEQNTTQVRTDKVTTKAEYEATRKRIDIFINLLVSRDKRVRDSAMQALHTIGGLSVPSLIKSFQDESWRGHQYARETLDSITFNAYNSDPQIIQPLINLLANENADVQRWVTQSLIRIGQPTVQPLIAALRNENAVVRKEAANILGRIRNKESVQSLINTLGDRDQTVRVSAVDALGQKDNPRAVESLIDALENEDPNTRRAAAYALGKVDDPRSVQPLINVLVNTDTNTRKAAAYALGQIHYKKAVQTLISELDNSPMDNWSSKRVVEYLSHIGGKKVVQLLIDTLGDEEQLVRKKVVETLDQIGDKEAIQILIDALGDERRYVRKEVTEVLSQMDNPQVAQSLINALESDDPGIRRVAADVLGQIGYRKAIQNLIKNSSNGNINDFRVGEAIKTLATIGGRTAVKLLIDTPENEDPSARRKAAEAFGRISDKVALQILINVSEKAGYYERRYTAYLLGKIGDTQSIQALIKATEKGTMAFGYVDYDDSVKSLIQIGEPAVKPLTNALKHEKSKVRAAAAYALGRIGDKAAVQSLIEAVKDKSLYVRTEAVIALSNMSDSRAVPVLIKALRDKDQPINKDVVKRLRKKQEKEAIQFYIQRVEDNVLKKRRYAAYSLGQVGDPIAVQPLIEALGDESLDLRIQAVRALGHIGTKETAEPLIKALRNKDLHIRRTASFALAHIGDKNKPENPLSITRESPNIDEAYRWITGTFQHRFNRRDTLPEDVQRKARSMDDQDRIRLIQKETTDTNTEVTALLDQAIWKTAVRPLIRALGDEDRIVREYAAKALGQIGDPKAIKPLVNALRDEDLVVRSRAQGALDALKWKPQTEREMVMYLIAKMSRFKYAGPDTLNKALTNKDWYYRRYAANALGDFRYEKTQTRVKFPNTLDDQAFQAIINALEDDDLVVRANIASTLGRIGNRQAVQSLINALTDESTHISPQAAIALGQIADPEAVQPLIKSLSNKNADIRMAAVSALGRIGDTQAVQPLIKTLEDENKYVCLFAAGALDSLNWKPQTEREEEIYQRAKKSWRPDSAKIIQPET